MSEPDRSPEAAPFYVRPLDKKMGMALARRTVFREQDQQDWGKVAERVAAGNTSLVPGSEGDYVPMRNAIASGALLMSGRHLQHGDLNQKYRPQEVYTNCSVAPTSFMTFYLLLNGSGVGRDYSDAMMLVDWEQAPKLVLVCRPDHPNFDAGVFSTPQAALQQLVGQTHTYFTVPDSREGWAMAAERYETMAFEGTHADETLVLDFSYVRPAGSPIAGMQNRPASGPVPTAQAFAKIAQVKGQGLPRWKQAMLVDHALAECVVVGGARRSARMSTKFWGDPGAIEFAHIKAQHGLWSSNNSIIATKALFEGLKEKNSWAQQVFKAVTEASYWDLTGEPGLICVDNFAPDPIDYSLYADGNYMGSELYQLQPGTKKYTAELAQAAQKMPYSHVTNPCSEIAINILGGFCVIGDVVPYHCDSLEQAEETFRIATRALIRVNTMRSVYAREVARTNRIGVSFTGIHEFAFKQFGLGFRELLDEHGTGKPFWEALARFSRAVKSEAKAYAAELGMATPVTDTTVKPAGSTSKLFALSEGAHLPSMREYLRNMQFRTDDPLVEQYRAKGYPVRELQTYQGTSIVGFPTQPTICKLGLGDKLVTASEATPEEQYQWLMLLEKYWIRGVDEQGEPLPDTGNQISFTLKYDPSQVTYKDFVRMMVKYQSRIRCCSVMPATDTSAYEYLPEQPFRSVGQFQGIVGAINDPEALEDIDMEHLQCQSGACPI